MNDKVLTANLGTLLDLYGVEKGLDHYKESQELSFHEFRYYLHREVFDALPAACPQRLREYEHNISEVCWLLCRKGSLARERPVFSDQCVFKLFRVFCLLADLVRDADDAEKYVVILQPAEAGIVAEQLVGCLGRRWDAAEWEVLSGAAGRLRWPAFLAVLEAKCCAAPALPAAALVEAVDDIYDVFIEDIIKKGYLWKRGYLLPTLREYWCVLRPAALTYYKNSAQREPCGRIAIPESCAVQPGGDGKLHFHLTTPERTFEFATRDHKSLLQWVACLREAARESRSGESSARRALARRREQRALLQAEVRARKAAEKHAQELVAIVATLTKEDSQKVEKLKQTQVELEKLLQEEIQAKRDEEIVRALQARVLLEEWEKREELERLQLEQSKLLEEERLKRQQFERLQAEKEAQFREAEQRLKELEAEKNKLDAELRAAQEKISETEYSAQVLKVHLKELRPAPRRALSFVPTSKSSSDTLIDVRAALRRGDADRDAHA